MDPYDPPSIPILVGAGVAILVAVGFWITLIGFAVAVFKKDAVRVRRWGISFGAVLSAGVCLIIVAAIYSVLWRRDQDNRMLSDMSKIWNKQGSPAAKPTKNQSKFTVKSHS